MDRTETLRLVNLCTVGRKSFHADTDVGDPVPLRPGPAHTSAVLYSFGELVWELKPYLQVC